MRSCKVIWANGIRFSWTKFRLRKLTGQPRRKTSGAVVIHQVENRRVIDLARDENVCRNEIAMHETQVVKRRTN